MFARTGGLAGTGAVCVPARFNAASGCAFAVPVLVRLRRTSRLREMTSTTRRFLARPVALVFGAIGWNTPYPTDARRAGLTPSMASMRTILAERAEDSSQLVGNCEVLIGWSSVKPSTWIGLSKRLTIPATFSMIVNALSLASHHRCRTTDWS